MPHIGVGIGTASHSESSADVIGDAELTFAANFKSVVDADYAAGDDTGTANGGAVIAAGKLNLKGDTVTYVDFDANLNADSQQVGCMRIKITPDYTGSPADNQVSCLILEAANNVDNLVGFHHIADGNLQILAFNTTGTLIFTTSLGVWAPTAGVEYIFEYNWDLTAGASRLFIDGTQFGSTEVTTGTRSSEIGLIRVGSNSNATKTSDFEASELEIFNVVQHVADFTP